VSTVAGGISLGADVGGADPPQPAIHRVIAKIAALLLKENRDIGITPVG
jgi:hypothetical protein